MSTFKPNDLVWAKMRGFPIWPGIIANQEELDPSLLTKLKAGKNSVIVYFPDSDSHSSLPLSSIFDYAKNREKFMNAKKTKDFKGAVEYIESLYKKSLGESVEEVSASNDPEISPRSSTPAPVPKTKAILSPQKQMSPTKEDSVSTEQRTTVETPKSVSNSQQWASTLPAKTYSRTPFSSRKRVSQSATNNNDKSSASEPAKKVKQDDSQEAPKQVANQPISGNVGVFGSGTVFQNIVRIIGQTQPVIYTSKNRISTEAWAAHNKANAKDVLPNCKYLIVHFGKMEEAREFFFGQDNKSFYMGLNEDKFVINLSPFNIKFSEQLDSNISKTGAVYLECSMFLSKPEDIRTGNFPIIVSGKGYQIARACINRISSNVHYVGEEIGKAFTVSNGLTAINVGCSAILREVCSVLHSNNIDLNTFNDILQNSSLASTSMSTSMGLICNDPTGSNIPAVHSSFNNKADAHYSLMKTLEAGSITKNPLILTGVVSQLIKK